jgi:regulator of cell morphogenesis and NO signaling
MRVDESTSIAKIADEISGARQVFETLGIDYACGGALSLADAAYAEGLDPEVLVAGVRRLAAPSGGTHSWNDRPLADLIKHLTDEHHRLVRDELAAISFGLFDLCAPPATPDEDLLSLRAAIVRLSGVLLPHMHEEEDNLFHPIAALELSRQSSERTVNGELRSRIQHVITEHGTIAAQLRSIRELRLRLEAGNELSERARAILESVTRLEAHLHEYMFLENCILFPRAVALQEQMTAA